MGVRRGVLDKQIVSADPEDGKSSVRLVTTVALPAYMRAGNVITETTPATGLPALDGVAPVLGDSILLKDGAAGADNGIYEVTDLGDGSNPFILTRRGDADTVALVNSGMRTSVEEGVQFGGKGTEFVLITPNPITLNATALDFVEVESGGGGGIFAVVSDPDVADIPEGTRSPILGSLSGDGAVGGEGILTQVNIDDNYTQFDVPLRNVMRVPQGQQMLYKGIPKFDGIVIADGIITEASESADELLETLGQVLDLDELLFGGGSPAVPVGPAGARSRLDVPSTAEVTAEIAAIPGLELKTTVEGATFTAEVGKIHVWATLGGPTTATLPVGSEGDRIGFLGDGSGGGATLVVNRAGSDTIATPNAGSLTTFSLTSNSDPSRSTYVELLFATRGGTPSWIVQRSSAADELELFAGGASKVIGTSSAGEITAFSVSDSEFVGVPSGGNLGPMTKAQALTVLNVEDGADVTDATNVNAAGAVMESDYNANTVLAATADNTPVALTVAEDTVVGRAKGGAISDLSTTSASGVVNSLGITNTEAGTMLQGAPVVSAGGPGDFQHARANTEFNSRVHGFVRDSAGILTTASGRVVFAGLLMIAAGTRTEAWSEGDVIYVDPATEGKLTNVLPTGVGEFIAPVGIAQLGGTSMLIRIEPITEIL